MGKRLNWSSSNRREIQRVALSIKEESEQMKTDAAAKWLKKADRQFQTGQVKTTQRTG